MLRDDVISLVIARLNRTDLNAPAILELGLLQATQFEGAPFLPWFTEYVDNNQVITANVETLATPTGFIREVDGAGLFYLDASSGKYIALPKDDYDNLVANLDPTGDTPQGYAIIGDSYYFRPVPTQGFSLKLIYNKREPDAGAANIENGWLKWAPDLVIGALGFVLATTYLQNPAQAQPFDTMRKEAIQRLNIMHEARTHANRDYRMGGTED